MLTRASALAFLFLLGTVPHRAPQTIGTFRLHVPAGSYFAGSRVRVDAEGVSGPYTLAILGPGSIDRGAFIAPVVNRPAWTTIVGASSSAVAYAAIRTVPPPASAHLIAVATYRGGIALHDERTFATLGNFAIAGAPADVAFLPNGSIVTSDTDGDTLTRIDRTPWSITNVSGVDAGNEIAVDSAGNIFVSDRDVQGQGALTRVTPSGAVTRVTTGVTAEGIALDSARHIAYVSNVNDKSIAAVDTQSMRLLQKIPAPERPFGIALDERGRRLYVVSNVSPSMTPGGGFVAAIALDTASPHVVMRSPHLKFPLGAAFDPHTKRVFVTDEAADVVYVLNAATLRQAHAPLPTCATPWRPHVSGDRLYVPCAREDRVDVFSLATLARVRGAPFPTSGYPLSVATWH
jgi:DNA-binding beta-propeller fold protein YncE